MIRSILLVAVLAAPAWLGCSDRSQSEAELRDQISRLQERIHQLESRQTLPPPKDEPPIAPAVEASVPELATRNLRVRETPAFPQWTTIQGEVRLSSGPHRSVVLELCVYDAEDTLLDSDEVILSRTIPGVWYPFKAVSMECDHTRADNSRLRIKRLR